MKVIFKCLLVLCFLSFSLCEDDGLFFGVATAAYQIEGATDVDGRGQTIWDEFVKLPGKIANNDTGDTADLSYFQYNDDIQLMKQIGVQMYRFSLAWSRIIPEGVGQVNEAGINHYNDVIDALLDAGITPVITLYHWDMPLALEQEYKGWLDTRIEEAFVAFADVCFSAFGNRVKTWITVNEPLTFALHGYGTGVHAPGRCSDRTRCSSGDTSRESYIVAHNVLNAHAAVVELYRTQYAWQGGQIGITLNIDWAYPLTSTKENIDAASRRNEFSFAWFGDPVFRGKYPDSMVKLVGDRLPTFTADQQRRLIGSTDFIGFNHYSSWYASEFEADEGVGVGGWDMDQRVVTSKRDVEGNLIGPQGGSIWLNMVPKGIYDALSWVSRRYGSPKIYITENGCDILGESEMSFPDVLNDTFRIEYYESYLREVLRAKSSGVNVKAYFAWSLLDNFEW
eukprot:CAMPEP_0185025116 /NCGR_PEP_ID=MMETSP1103-20130426/8194_1 /TAXON_ID=36769 /ORGANISM="Paraphysomonas bandaiensis, Strain Caron Lab Isolate" /LENGTH=451 /DNA_ID=CAMNT_0027558241 /DNA_START=80 /DNA_END=1432 /DNA_ORIENTATION=+